MATLILPQRPVNGTTAAPSGADISASVIRITPQMARDLLKDRPCNRPVSKARVQALIADLQAGRWQVNGEAIIVDHNIKLIDGQHRLMAIAASGVTVEALVVVGVPQSAMTSIDQGKSRSAADTLAAASIRQAKQVAATARWVWRIENDAMRVQTIPLCNQHLPAFVEAHPALHNALSWGSAILPIVPSSCAAAFFWAFAQKDAVLAKSYYSALRSGEGLQAGDPALCVRQRAFTERLQTMRHSVIVGRAALLVLGWNCTRASKPCPKGMNWRGETDQAVPFPKML